MRNLNLAPAAAHVTSCAQPSPAGTSLPNLLLLLQQPLLQQWQWPVAAEDQKPAASGFAACRAHLVPADQRVGSYFKQHFNLMAGH